jgi:hypothetical protein
MVVASPAIRKAIRAVGIREMMRRTKLHQHTIERILRGQQVRTRTLGAVLDALQAGPKSPATDDSLPAAATRQASSLLSRGAHLVSLPVMSSTSF